MSRKTPPSNTQYSDKKPDWDETLSDLVDEESAFRAAMGDVQPIKKSERVVLKSENTSDENLRRRRAAAVKEAATVKEALSGSFVEQVDPLDIIEFKRPGIQHGVYKNLRLGKYNIDARLDLHRMTVDHARTAVAGFIKDCVEHDVRCGLITHGKGENREQPALLKSCINYWLPQLTDVMAFHSAQKQHGGPGATYVLIRKSEKRRQENLEKHQRKPR